LNSRWMVCTSLSVNVFVTPHSNIWNAIVKLFLKHPVHSPVFKFLIHVLLLGSGKKFHANWKQELWFQCCKI
jgi:hypothetical protein